MAYSTAWKPIVTHLVDDDGDGSRTLCGIPTQDLTYGGEVDAGECGCIRCRRISQQRSTPTQDTQDADPEI